MIQPLLLLAPCVLLAASAAAMPIGVWNTTIGGVPNSKLPNAPQLGNGYTGIVLADGPFDTLPLLQTVDLWINTNAMWGCDNNTGGLTPALCAMVGLGGVSFAVPALLPPPALASRGRSPQDATTTPVVSFHAEQRVGPARRWGGMYA